MTWLSTDPRTLAKLSVGAFVGYCAAWTVALIATGIDFWNSYTGLAVMGLASVLAGVLTLR